jgi:hypothetical protein
MTAAMPDLHPRPGARRFGTVLALLVAVLLASRGVAAEELCGSCKATGRVKHETPGTAAIEQGCKYCSVVMDKDPDALGLDWVPCPKCTAPEALKKAQSEHQRELTLRRAFLEKVKAIDRLVGAEIVHVQSANFLVSFAIPKITIGRETLDMHRAAHEYLERAVDLRRQMMELSGLTEETMFGILHHTILFEREKHAKVAAPQYTGIHLSGGAHVYKIGIERSAIVMWDDPDYVKNDEQRHHLFVHLVSHMVTHDRKDYRWWLFDKHGWLYEGIGYAWEYRVCGNPEVSCGQEQARAEHSKGDFESSVRKSYTTPVPFATLIERNPTTLKARERLFAWSYVDFLMWYDPQAFAAFTLRLLDPEVATRDALRETYGLSMLDLQAQWADYVRSNYSSQPRKGKIVRPPRVPAKAG